MSVKRQRGTYAFGENGLEATAVFNIDCADEAAALTDLAAHTYPVTRGTVFKTHQNTTPDSACICQSLEVTTQSPAPVGGTGLYIVTARFARNTPQQGPDPTTTLTAAWYVERSLTTAPADHDVTGAAIVNTAHEPIDPALVKNIISRTLVAKWYVTGTSWLNVYNQFKVYEGKLNSTTFAGAVKGSLLCESMEPSEAGNGKYLITARFAYREPKTLFSLTYEGWTDTVLNLGRRTKGAIVDGRREYPPIIMNGVPVSDPVPLDSGGQRLADGSNPIVLAFNHYSYINFNDLGIG